MSYEYVKGSIRVQKSNTDLHEIYVQWSQLKLANIYLDNMIAKSKVTTYFSFY